MTMNFSDTDHGPSPLHDGLTLLRATPWAVLLWLSLAVGGLLLLRHVWALQFVPEVDIGTWVGWLVLAWSAGVWLVLWLFWGLGLPMLLLDAPSTPTPWRRALVALFGLAAAALVLQVWVLSLDAIYVFFGLFVLVALIAFRAVLVKLDVRHGVFIFTHDVLEVGLWALWGALPALAWTVAGGPADDVMAWRWVLWTPCVLALVVVAVAHAPRVLQPRMRALTLLVSVVLGVAVLSRPAVLERWSQGLWGLSAQTLPVTLVLTEAGCHAANTALGKQVCWYDPIARQGIARNARMVSHHGAQVVVQMNHSLSKSCLTAADIQGVAWKRMVLRKEAVIAWGQDVEGDHRACVSPRNP
jgi:hypothetical protein